VIELVIQERGKKLENAIRVRSMKATQHATEWQTLKITPSGLELVSRRRCFSVGAHQASARVRVNVFSIVFSLQVPVLLRSPRREGLSKGFLRILHG
jgi:hypothetical protein